MSKKIKTPVLDETKQTINIPQITKEEKLKHISSCSNFYSVQSDTGMHCHAIEDEFKDLVKEVLKRYGFPDRKIEELFEGKIYQVKIAD